MGNRREKRNVGVSKRARPGFVVHSKLEHIRVMLPGPRVLKSWAQRMAHRYAQEIPDYSRLDDLLLFKDVAVVSFECLRGLRHYAQGEGLPRGELEGLAMAAGQRRREQRISLSALLRAYRLWGKQTLVVLSQEAPAALPRLALGVAELVDLASEVSSQAYSQPSCEPLLQGRVVGVAIPREYPAAGAVLPRYLAALGQSSHWRQDHKGFYLYWPGTLEDVLPQAQRLAQEAQAVVLLQQGKGERLGSLHEDLEEAIRLVRLSKMRPGAYETRVLWPLALVLDSPKGQERLLGLLAPLEGHPELVATVQEYLEARLSPKRVAHRLGVHINTVFYRLRRVEELTGCDLGRLEDLTLLQLAFRLEEAMRRPSSG